MLKYFLENTFKMNIISYGNNVIHINESILCYLCLLIMLC